MKVQMNTMLRSALLMSAASASLLAAPSIAQAQTAGEATVDVGEIVVTGSRIRRDTFSSPQPLAVVSAEAIREQGQVSIGDLLLEQPVINPATNAQNSSGTLFLAGQARADIRGLGPTRTLVLMDNRRLPFSDASSPAVDLNTIPSLMVERIETIAGGVSAVYGSEAIAGVVNFIMKKEQDGLELDVQGGVTQEGDGEEYRAGFNWGSKFFDDKLNILIGGEVASQDTIMQRDRSYGDPGIRRDTRVTPQPIIPASRANTSPFATFQLIGGALGTARSVTLDARNPTNVVRLSAACSTATVQPDCQDPALFYSGPAYNTLQGKSNRQVIRGYADYKITDTWKAFVDLSYLHGSGYGIFQPAFSSAAGGGTMPVVLRGDNAYLNGAGATAAALRAEWLAAGKTFTQGSTAQVGKFWQEFGGRDVKAEREQVKYTGGIEGKFQTFGRDVSMDSYVQYSEVTGTTISFNVPNVARVQQATDAVLLNGAVVCRDAAARAAGCTPWDLVNGASREAILWTNGVATSDQKLSQTVAGINFATDIFDLPAGPVGVAFGGEYRKEKSQFVQDALSASGALFFNAIGTREGEYDVREAYAEIRIPILKDLPFAEELTVEAAGRVSDYSTIGGTDQWRVNVTWAPVKDIRFRATESTAVRAPNIVELFAPQGRNFTTTALDPCDSANFRAATAAQQAARRVTCAAAIPGYNPTTFVSNIGTGRPSLALLQGGNPDLGAERAHTFQYGVVINPRWVPNLQISADFFKYNITDQVGSIPINTLLGALCYDDASRPIESNQFCQQIRRDRTGATTGGLQGGIFEVVLVQQNVASVKVEGWDYSVSYGFQTEDLFGKDYGSIAMRVDATWMYQWALQGLPTQAYTQFANTITNATPEWKGTASARWSYDKFSFTWSTIYIGSMIANQAQQRGVIDPFKTGDYFRHDIRATYRLNDDIRLRAGVVNAFNKKPPQLPETFTGTGTGSSQYDNAGRFFFVGANMEF
ncbi:TonB-dependent receptor plug domain-containing protein [Phenylobacterium sp.]|uniref:TonB-dependent receptor plug domain-containing protein n=1 Tax=Phenylobacterium sp. TaxID=1871053 RepID=UPI003D2BF679